VPATVHPSPVRLVVVSSLPPPGCWSCGRLPSEEDIRIRSLLHPRAERDGGPVTILRCPECAAETVVEEIPGGDVVLATLYSAGLSDGVAATLFDGPDGREQRRRAQAWTALWHDALVAMRLTRAAQRRSDAKPPPRSRPQPRPASAGPKKRSRKRAPDPALPRSPRTGLPSTQAEARGILGIAASAAAKEIDRAYREMSRKCHPDLVAHLDEDFQRLAHEKFLRLKRAHELLRPRRGSA